jgi:hypothetical protein
MLGAALAVALAMVMAVANRQRPTLNSPEWRATVFPVNMLLSFCCCFFWCRHSMKKADAAHIVRLVR